jgi:hypothetical protein
VTPEPKNTRDLLSSPLFSIVIFCLPIAAIIASGQLGAGNGLKTAIWTVACLIIGMGCAVNAARCGRLHCYFTGPFFLIMAAVICLYGLGVLPLGANGWNWLSVALLAGGLLGFGVPELFFGKYHKARSQDLN